MQIMIITFLLLLVLGIPIGFAMGIISIGSILALGSDLRIVSQKMFTGIDVFTYLAIPLFILAAQIMNKSGITRDLVRFCDDLIGHVTGGLAHVNVLNSMLFAGLSGSAVSDVAGLGTLEISMMEEGGYDTDFSAGITAASAIIGPIIPPSIVMIIYAVTAGNVSVGSLFIAGFIPGILIGISLMSICYIISKIKKYPKREQRASFKELVTSFIRTFPVFVMPLIILGGILTGLFTATESAAVAVFYALILSFILKTIKIEDLSKIFLETAKTTSAVLFIIATSSVIAWVVTSFQIPQKFAQFFLDRSHSKEMFLFYTNIILLLTGMLLDLTPALLIMVPILSPAAIILGINPLHFGMIVTLNLCIGLITPPIGMVLFVTSNVAKIGLSRIYKAIWPFLIGEVVILALITYIPALTTWIPSLFALK
jgi:tripartite ATP-independent transporter DctM subunit